MVGIQEKGDAAAGTHLNHTAAEAWREPIPAGARAADADNGRAVRGGSRWVAASIDIYKRTRLQQGTYDEFDDKALRFGVVSGLFALGLGLALGLARRRAADPWRARRPWRCRWPLPA